MGLTNVRAIVSNPTDRSRARELKFLVDSGAIALTVLKPLSDSVLFLGCLLQCVLEQKHGSNPPHFSC